MVTLQLASRSKGLSPKQPQDSYISTKLLKTAKRGGAVTQNKDHPSLTSRGGKCISKNPFSLILIM